jgi:hypothetical protein
LYYNIFDLGEVTYKKYKEEIGFKLTAYQYAELINAYEWHRQNFEKERKRLIKELLSAYIYKHDIYSTSEAGEDKEESNCDLDSIYRIIELAKTLDNVTYRKQLN